MSVGHRLFPGAFLFLMLAAPLAAQDPAPAPPQEPPPAPEDILFDEREVFSYPDFLRRNPFKPLVGDEGGPRYEDIALRGVIVSDDPRESVALLGLRQRAAQLAQQQVQQQIQAQAQGTAPIDTIVVREVTQRLRIGQRWGNIQIMQILIDHVVVNVDEFGVIEQRILRMPTRVQGGR